MKTGLSIITFLDSLFTSRDIICSPLNFWFSLLFDPQQMGTEATRGLLVIHLVPAILV